MEHRDLHVEIADERHVVLDHDDGVCLGDALQEFCGLSRLFVGHAGGGLVDEEKLRVLCEEHSDLQPLPLAMAQAAGEKIAQMAEADRLQDILDLSCFLRAQAMEQRGEDAALALQRELDIVPHRVELEDRRLLEFSADAELGDLRLVVARQIDSLEEDVAGVGAGLAGDDVHHRGLSGAVRPDDGAHLALFDRERERVQRLEPVERHADVVEVEEGRRGE